MKDRAKRKAKGIGYPLSRILAGLGYWFNAPLWLFVALGLGGCQGSESTASPKQEKSQPKAVKVSVVTVEPVPLKDILVLPGETEAWEDVRVAADMDGVVEWIGPREGDSIKKGDLLARIDVSARKAALDRAEASFRLADELHKRRVPLFERKIISKEELDRTTNELTLAETHLRQAQVEYDRGFLRAPISGRVNHLYVDAGEFVGRGAPVADMVNVEKIKINASVPELDVRYFKTGQKAEVRVDAFPDLHIQGTIDFVAYKADFTTRTFLVRVLISNPDLRIRPGMIARVAFLRRIIPDALLAPLFAILDKGGERLLFVEENGIARARVITPGVIEADKVQILKGLQVGDHLIVTGQTEVEEGIRVQVQ